MQETNRRAEDHFDCLDGLKGICACLIAFVWHYQHFIPMANAPFQSFFPVSCAYGDRLVELFFMLSGFGMMSGYGEKILRRSVSFPRYMQKRITRLYPLFILTTFSVIPMELLIYHKTGIYFVYQNLDLYHLILNMLLLQNGALTVEWSLNSPSWTISVLMLLYILFYEVCYVSRNKRAIYYWFAVLALIGLIIILDNQDRPLINSQTGRGLACFSIGVLLRGIYQKKDQFNTKALAYLSLCFLAAAYMLIRRGRTQYVGNMIMFVILGAAPMTVCSALYLPWMTRILSCRPLLYLGKISMAIYLLHFPVQCVLWIVSLLIIPMDFSSAWIWLLYIFLTILTAVVYSGWFSQKYEPWLIKIFRGRAGCIPTSR